MNWKKILLSFILLTLFVQLILIGDVYQNADKPIQLVEISKGKYKSNLSIRSFYIYDQFSKDELHDENKTFRIKSFPEKSFGDGVNYGNNIAGLPSWVLFRSEELNLNSNSIIIPYDYNLLFILRFNKEIIIRVERNENNEPISLFYTIEDKP